MVDLRWVRKNKACGSSRSFDSDGQILTFHHPVLILLEMFSFRYNVATMSLIIKEYQRDAFAVGDIYGKDKVKCTLNFNVFVGIEKMVLEY